MNGSPNYMSTRLQGMRSMRCVPTETVIYNPPPCGRRWGTTGLGTVSFLCNLQAARRGVRLGGRECAARWRVLPRPPIQAPHGLHRKRVSAAGHLDRQGLARLDAAHLEEPPAPPAFVGMIRRLDTQDAPLLVDRIDVYRPAGKSASTANSLAYRRRPQDQRTRFGRLAFHLAGELEDIPIAIAEVQA